MEQLLSALPGGLGTLADFILHIDLYMDDLVARYGWQVYLILFGIVFWETGVVIMPFLPGDSLLFASGAIAGREAAPLSVWALFAIIGTAAFLGDTANYWIGRWIGPKALDRDGRFLKRKYLDRTRAFYERHGPKTIVLARFVPIVRTFAPFVAGIGAMRYRRFLFYNVTGGLAWTLIFVGAGYFFGSLPLVRRNFTLVILVIVVLSVLPMVVEFIRARREGRRDGLSQAASATAASVVTAGAAGNLASSIADAPSTLAFDGVAGVSGAACAQAGDADAGAPAGDADGAGTPAGDAGAAVTDADQAWDYGHSGTSGPDSGAAGDRVPSGDGDTDD
jgi:membrane-associated protein